MHNIIGLSSVLRLRQHSIGYMGDGESRQNFFCCFKIVSKLEFIYKHFISAL